MLNFMEKQKNVSPKRVFVSYIYRGSKIDWWKKNNREKLSSKKKVVLLQFFIK